MPDLTFAVKLLGNGICLNARVVLRLRYGRTHQRPQHHKDNNQARADCS